MMDPLSPEMRSAVMARIRATNTQPNGQFGACYTPWGIDTDCTMPSFRVARIWPFLLGGKSYSFTAAFGISTTIAGLHPNT
jgi:hypothetical protein